MDSIIGDGNPDDFNTTLVHVADVNGTSTIVLNGTLPNGTQVTSGAFKTATPGLSWMLGWLTISAITFFIL